MYQSKVRKYVKQQTSVYKKSLTINLREISKSADSLNELELPLYRQEEILRKIIGRATLALSEAIHLRYQGELAQKFAKENL